tara:strand:+ start:998 stop:1309 length:312 start_codon:yes stop_codon:yes gene_type:complete
MKYKQEYLKLKEQLAAETKEKQKYEGWWHQESDDTASKEAEIKKLEKRIKEIELFSLQVETKLLKKIVALYEREPQKTIIESGISGQFATPNGATTSSTTTII